MSGRFHAHGAFPIHMRGIFAIYGELTDGVARAGQIAIGPGGFRGRVHDIEFIRHEGGEENMALTFSLPSDQQRIADLIAQVGDSEISLWETEGQADAHLGAG